MHRDGGWGVPSGIKAGIIGELGCSFPLHDGERKTLHAAALAQRLTGAAIQIHPGRDATSPMEILRELQAAGADMTRVVMCHMDRTVFTQEGALEIARTGCYMEYDLFGNYVSGFCEAHKSPLAAFLSVAKLRQCASIRSAQPGGGSAQRRGAHCLAAVAG